MALYKFRIIIIIMHRIRDLGPIFYYEWHKKRQQPCWQTILAQCWPNIDILGPDWPTLQYWANVGAILWCQCNGVAILANVGAILNNNKQWQNFNANDLGTKVLQVC